MTTLYNTSDKEISVEVEQFVNELSASTEYELLAIGISVWLFLRVYSLGICLIGRLAGYELD